MRIKPTQKPVQRQKPVRSPKHLKFIRSLPCLLCVQQQHITEAAHVNYSDADYGKFNTKGVKADDCWTVPLCSECHRGKTGQHNRGERIWWESKGIDPLPICLSLWHVSGNIEAGLAITSKANWRQLT